MSFTDLLDSSGVDLYEDFGGSSVSLSLNEGGGIYPDRTGSGFLPKYKTAQPPPLLPISQPSSSSHTFAFSDFIDSPLLLSSSHTLISPTTGAFPFQGLNIVRDMFANQATLLSFIAVSQLVIGRLEGLQETCADQDRHKLIPLNQIFGSDRQTTTASRRKASDGYGWRKYGQKQTKKSENPRSYFKCTYPNCFSKKIVETASDGQITEIIYKGGHNHPKPEFTKRPSGSSRMFNPSSVVSEHSENSSISFDYTDLDKKRFKSEHGEIEEEEEDEQHETKRLKREGEDEGMSVEVSRGVKEPRVVVQTISEIDVLVDGFRWRKYGQKVVKGNTNPRSYYKCTYQGCGVRKQVERSAEDERAVLTTYEGRHNHDVPTSLRRS